MGRAASRPGWGGSSQNEAQRGNSVRGHGARGQLTRTACASSSGGPSSSAGAAASPIKDRAPTSPCVANEKRFSQRPVFFFSNYFFIAHGLHRQKDTRGRDCARR
jgi:hypothetical protein